MTVARKQGIQSFLAAGNLQEIYGYARLNLCSASHVTRLLTLKILACFDQEEKVNAPYSYPYGSTRVSREWGTIRGDPSFLCSGQSKLERKIGCKNRTKSTVKASTGCLARVPVRGADPHFQFSMFRS